MPIVRQLVEVELSTAATRVGGDLSARLFDSRFFRLSSRG
jgi:hypothetical protein